MASGSHVLTKHPTHLLASLIWLHRVGTQLPLSRWGLLGKQQVRDMPREAQLCPEYCRHSSSILKVINAYRVGGMDGWCSWAKKKKKKPVRLHSFVWHGFLLSLLGPHIKQWHHPPKEKGSLKLSLLNYYKEWKNKCKLGVKWAIQRKHINWAILWLYFLGYSFGSPYERWLLHRKHGWKPERNRRRWYLGDRRCLFLVIFHLWKTFLKQIPPSIYFLVSGKCVFFSNMCSEVVNLTHTIY